MGTNINYLFVKNFPFVYRYQLNAFVFSKFLHRDANDGSMTCVLMNSDWNRDLHLDWVVSVDLLFKVWNPRCNR